ncbi:MAG: hypothetical protein IAG10_06165 [Planctomycetaceae bacterium]|nr:hypothetical protein [Planctomycetaceae bacterium]
MSFLGKLLVGLQLVLSIMFLVFAGAVFSTQKNWKAAKEVVDSNYTKLDGEKKQVEVEYSNFKDRMVRELKVEQDRAATAEGQVDLLKRQLASSEDEANKAKIERDEQRELAKVSVEESKQRREEALQQREINNNLQKLLNEKTTRLQASEDVIFNQKVAEKTLQDKHSKVLSDLALMQKIIAANGLSTDPQSVIGLLTPPPAVDGEVLETKKGARNGSDLIEISIGSDDGLAEGHKLSVYRPQAGDKAAKFLGDIKLVYVTPDRAVGAVILRAKNGIIERGDNVTSKLGQ